MFVLVSYDIESDKLRAKIADALEAHGRRVQYSVFECNLTSVQYDALKERLRRLVERYADAQEEPGGYSVRLYRLCKACTERFDVLGEGRISQDEAFYLV